MHDHDKVKGIDRHVKFKPLWVMRDGINHIYCSDDQ